MRLAVVTSHPMPYQVPIWRELSTRAGLEVKVLYASDAGISAFYSAEFASSIKWDTPLLEGYQHAFLPNRPLEWLNWRYKYRCPSIGKELREGGYDAILVVGKENAYYLDAVRAANNLRIPVLYRADGPVNRGGRLRTWIAEMHRKSFYSRISAFLCIGSRQYEFYSRYLVPRERMFWSPHCVDNDFFRTQAEALSDKRMDLRRSYGFSGQTRVIGFCGKLTEWKRPMDLLRALTLVKDKDKYGALFIGDGPLRVCIKSFVEQHGLRNVIVTGFTNHSKLGERYVVADCFVLPSTSETWGLVVNEAMNFALPVVVSDQVACGTDLVQGNGHVYPMGDVEALSQSLERIFATDEFAKTLGQRSLAIVDRFSVQAAADGIEQALRSAVAPRGS